MLEELNDEMDELNTANILDNIDATVFDAFLAGEDALESRGVVSASSPISDTVKYSIEEYEDHIAENGSCAADESTDDDVQEELHKASLREIIATKHFLLRDIGYLRR